MARRRATIPPKAQIPLAVVLIVMFGGLLLWRSFSDGDEEVDASVHTSDTVGDTNLAMAQLSTLLGAFGTAGGDIPQNIESPTLPRDPFARSDAFAIRLGIEGFGETAFGVGRGLRGAVSAGLRGIHRNEFLEEAGLTGVLMMGDRAKAVLDGRYLEVGDWIEGFIVKSIGKTQITLEDELGEAIIWMDDPAEALRNME